MQLKDGMQEVPPLLKRPIFLPRSMMRINFNWALFFLWFFRETTTFVLLLIICFMSVVKRLSSIVVRLVVAKGYEILSCRSSRHFVWYPVHVF